MDNRVLNQMEGIIAVRLLGRNGEKIINMAIARGIFIWNIRRRDNCLEFKVRKSAYTALESIVRDNGYQIEIIHEQGFPFLKKVIQRRIGFFGGAIFFLLAIYLMSSFIWFIEVVNNEKVDHSTIILTAAKHGLYRGAAKWSFSRSHVEEAILLDINQFSYVKVDINGVKATIEVVEKIFPGEDVSGPCHIVAAKDGVVEEILLLEGQANIKEGEVVSKGDILISGIVFYEPSPYLVEQDGEMEPDTPMDIVRARGIVRARVWYEGYGECKRISENIIYTGRENRQIIITSPWKDFMIKGMKDPGYELSSTQIMKKEISSPLGKIGWHDIIIREKSKIITRLNEREALKIAREKAMQNLALKMKEENLPEDMKVEVLSSPSDSVLRCKIEVEVIEDIAKAEPINEQ